MAGMGPALLTGEPIVLRQAACRDSGAAAGLLLERWPPRPVTATLAWLSFVQPRQVRLERAPVRAAPIAIPALRIPAKRPASVPATPAFTPNRRTKDARIGTSQSHRDDIRATGPQRLPAINERLPDDRGNEPGTDHNTRQRHPIVGAGGGQRRHRNSSARDGRLHGKGQRRLTEALRVARPSPDYPPERHTIDDDPPGSSVCNRHDALHRPRAPETTKPREFRKTEG